MPQTLARLGYTGIRRRYGAAMAPGKNGAVAAERFPFDQIYKAMCGHPDTIRDMLRHFLVAPRGPLPRAALGAMDLRTVARLPAEWITRDFRARRGDLVASVGFRESARRAGYPRRLFMHFEHQSRPDRVMAMRFVEYGSEFYRELLASGAVREGETCPILCVLVYNGRTPWSVRTRTGELAAVPSVLRREPGRDVPGDLAAYFPQGYHALDLLRHGAEAPIPGSVVSMMIAIEYAGWRHLAGSFAEGPLAQTWRGLAPTLRKRAASWIQRVAQRHGIDAELEDLMQLEEVGRVTSRLEESIDAEIAQARDGGQRDLVRGLAAVKYGERAASRLAVLLAGVSEQSAFQEAAACMLQVADAEELLARVRGIVRRGGNGAPSR